MLTAFRGLMAILLSASLAHAGGVVGNGGDAAICSPSVANDLAGAYALDFLLEDRKEPALPAPETSMDSLVDALRDPYPGISDGLSRFRDGLFSTDPGGNFVWKAAPDGLVQLDDQKLVELLPPNCRKVVQAVIREERPAQTVFHYDPAIVEQLRARPAQLSYLLIHEWLWGYTSDVSVIRDANGIIHGSSFTGPTLDRDVAALKKMGLFATSAFGRQAVLAVRWDGSKISLSSDGLELTPESGTFYVHRPPAALTALWVLSQDGGTFLSVYPDGFLPNPSQNLARPIGDIEPGEEKGEAHGNLSPWKDEVFWVVVTRRAFEVPVQAVRVLLRRTE
jgi:hypothetical protein